MEELIGELLELRIRVRRNPQAKSLVDLALSLMTRLDGATDAELADLTVEITRIHEDLALRFGAPSNANVQ